MPTLSTSFYIRRAATNGTSITINKDATSVTYAVSTDGVNPPTSGWQTAVPTVPEGSYLWSKTVVTYSNGESTTAYGVSKQGKQGADGTSVTIKSKSVLYAVTDTATQPDDSAFTSSSVPTVKQGQYLWSKTVVTYSPSGETKTYSVSRIGSDGENVAGHSSYLHLAYASSSDGKENFSLTTFTGATYLGVCVDENEADPTEYTAYAWTKIKGEQGEKGKDGSDGKDGADGASAWSVRLSPEVLSFTADKDGTLDSASKTATITAYYGQTAATITIVQKPTNIVGCTASAYLSTKIAGQAEVSLAPTTTAITSATGKYAPATAGSCTVQLTAKNAAGETQTLTASVSFTCDVCTQWGQLIANDTEFSSQLGEVESTANSAQSAAAEATKTANSAKTAADNAADSVSTLTTSVSKIEQTAKEIQLSVMQTVDYHNYIPNSYINLITNLAAAGSNCQRRFWLPAGKYVFSINARVITGGKLLVRIYASSWSTYVAALTLTNTELGTYSTEAFEVTTAGFYYVGMQYVGSYYAHIRYMNLDAGEVATAWTRCPDDQIPAPNLFPTAGLYASDATKYSTTDPFGQTAKVDRLIRSSSSGVVGIYPDVTGLLRGETYTFSFYHRGAAVNVFLWTGNSSDTPARGAVNILAPTQYATDGNGTINIPQAATWHRVAVTFSLPYDSSTFKSTVQFVIQPPAAGTVYLTGYRIERGGRVTESETVNENDLLATGIDIQNKKITVTSDNFEIQNNAGVTTATVDKEGNLTVPAVQTVDKTDGSGNPTGHIIIRNGVITVYGMARKEIEIGVDAKTDCPYIEGYNANGTRIWRLDENGISSYLGADSIHEYDAFSGYFELISSQCILGDSFSSDREAALTTDAATTKTLTAEENAALIADAAANDYSYYRYVAGRNSKGDIIADTDENHGAVYNDATESKNADDTFFTTDIVETTNALASGLVLYNAIPTVTVSNGRYTYTWKAYKVQLSTNGYAYFGNITYRWTYTTPS